MSFRIAESGVPGNLRMGGRLTIENAAAVREALVRALRQADCLALSLDSDVAADISFLQVLCAARRTAARENKTFDIDSSAAPDLRTVMKEAGFVHDRGGFCMPGGKGAGTPGGDHD